MKTASNGAVKKIASHSHPSRPVTETLTNGFFTVDDKWTVIYWNKSAEKILGVAASDIVGRNLWDKFAAILPLELYALDKKVFQQGNPVHFEEYWGEMGAWFDVIAYRRDNLLSVSFKSGNHTEQRDNPIETLRTLTELYRFVTEITNDCLWEWDLQTQEIFWMDGGHKKVFGYQVENALIPQSFWQDCIHPEDRSRVLQKLQSAIDRYICTWEDEYRFKKADGSYTMVHDRGHIIYDNDLVALRMIGATQEIIKKVLPGEKLEETIPKIFPAITTPATKPQVIQKHAALFSSALAHEVRNPLANLSLAAELMAAENLTDEQRKLLDIMVRGTERIHTLVTDLLDTYREVEIYSGLYSMRDLLDRILVMTGDRLSFKKVVITSDYAEGDDRIFVNMQEIKIALINIIINAIDAMPAENAQLKLVTKIENGACIIIIEDNGIGISEANLKKIFQPYFTNKIGGMGLGLATTMDILLSNNARLEVESEVGRWTRFIISFAKRLE